MRVVIEIPENDYNHIREYYEKNEIVEATYSYIYHGIVLPEQHGDLIERDNLRCENADFDTYNDYCTMFDEIYNAPTILEATREGE